MLVSVLVECGTCKCSKKQAWWLLSLGCIVRRQSYSLNFIIITLVSTRLRRQADLPRDGQHAVVMRQVAGDVQTAPVVDDADQVAAAQHSCVSDAHWHLNARSVDGDLRIWVDLDLSSTGDDRQALLDWLVVAGAVVVHDDAERAADEVAGEQVGALSGELKETTIECHVVLSSGQTGVACQ